MYKGGTLEDNVLFMYAAAIVAAGEQMPLQEFLDFIDENPGEVEKFFTELDKEIND